MNNAALALTAPVSLIIAACSIALLSGADGWLIAKTAGICLPILAYCVFSIFTVIWAIKVGEVGVHATMTLQAKFFFWHGVSVVLCVVLAAAGSFVVMFALQMKGVLGAALR